MERRHLRHVRSARGSGWSVGRLLPWPQVWQQVFGWGWRESVWTCAGSVAGEGPGVLGDCGPTGRSHGWVSWGGLGVGVGTGWSAGSGWVGVWQGGAAHVSMVGPAVFSVCHAGCVRASGRVRWSGWGASGSARGHECWRRGMRRWREYGLVVLWSLHPATPGGMTWAVCGGGQDLTRLRVLDGVRHWGRLWATVALGSRLCPLDRRGVLGHCGHAREQHSHVIQSPR